MPMPKREWNADAYDRLSAAQFEWGKKVLQRVPLQGGETVLDAGCGTGRLTAELAHRLPKGRGVALDLSENMLRAARAKLCVFPNVSFVCADVQRLPFYECFDGVFSTATFHWAKDHEQLFQSLFRALKPGGWLVAQCGGSSNLRRLREAASKLMSSPKFARFFQGWSDPWTYATLQETAERMRRVGFTEVKTWEEAASFSLPDFDTTREYLATVTLHQHIRRIEDETLKDEFLDELARQVRGDMDYWRMNLEGRRPGNSRS